MIGENRRAEIRSLLADVLRAVDEGATLAETKAGLMRVFKVIDRPQSWDNKWAEAVILAAEQVTGMPRALFLSRARNLEYTEVRYIVYAVLASHTSVSLSHLSELLGFRQHHTSVLNALQRCEEWRKYVAGYEETYKAIDARASELFKMLSTDESA